MMNKYEELKHVLQDASWYLNLTSEQRLAEIETRGSLPESNPDVPLTGTVRVLIAVEARVPTDNDAEFGFSGALDRAVQEAIRNQWAIKSWDTWVQYLDGPAAGIIV